MPRRHWQGWCKEIAVARGSQGSGTPQEPRCAGCHQMRAPRTTRRNRVAAPPRQSPRIAIVRSQLRAMSIRRSQQAAHARCQPDASPRGSSSRSHHVDACLRQLHSLSRCAALIQRTSVRGSDLPYSLLPIQPAYREGVLAQTSMAPAHEAIGHQGRASLERSRRRWSRRAPAMPEDRQRHMPPHPEAHRRQFSLFFGFVFQEFFFGQFQRHSHCLGEESLVVNVITRFWTVDIVDCHGVQMSDGTVGSDPGTLMIAKEDPIDLVVYQFSITFGYLYLCVTTQCFAHNLDMSNLAIKLQFREDDAK